MNQLPSFGTIFLAEQNLAEQTEQFKNVKFQIHDTTFTQMFAQNEQKVSDDLQFFSSLTFLASHYDSIQSEDIKLLIF